MRLADKIRYLREVEGSLRGLNRAMTQGELLRAVNDAGGKLSQSYLSQIESGARPHLTNTTRLLLAKFFNVHPGYLVDDPEGYHAELLSDVRNAEDKLDLWLIGGAERFRRDADLRRSLLAIARHQDSRRAILLLECILDTPDLAERLIELLRPSAAQGSSPADPPASPATNPGGPSFPALGKGRGPAVQRQKPGPRKTQAKLKRSKKSPTRKGTR